VPDHDIEARQTLCVRGADEVLIEHFEHRGARHAGDETDMYNGKGSSGQGDRAQPAGEAFLRRDEAAGRQHAEMEGEDKDEHQPEPEFGDGETEQRRRHHGLIGPAVMVDRRDDAGEHAEHDRGDKGDASQR
jgi:hypothetical protein